MSRLILARIGEGRGGWEQRRGRGGRGVEGGEILLKTSEFEAFRPLSFPTIKPPLSRFPSLRLHPRPRFQDVAFIVQSLVIVRRRHRPR